MYYGSDLLFRNDSTRHEAEQAYLLYDPSNGQYIFAIYDDSRGLYDALVSEMVYADDGEDDEGKEVITDGFLSDSDLSNSVIKGIYFGEEIDAGKKSFMEV